MGNIEKNTRISQGQQLPVGIAIGPHPLAAEILGFRLDGVEEAGGEFGAKSNLLRLQVFVEDGGAGTIFGADIGPAAAIGIANRMMIDDQMHWPLRRIRVVPRSRLRIDHADHPELIEIKAIEGYNIDFEFPHHCPIFASADDAAETDSHRLPDGLDEEVLKGHGRGERIGIGVVVSDNQHPPLSPHPVEETAGEFPRSGQVS